MIKVMKQLFKLIIEFLQIGLIARFFVVGLMGLCFIDCAAFYYRLYAFSLQMLSLSFFTLTFFVILYWRRMMNVEFSRQANFCLLLLRMFIFVALIAPLAFNQHWELITPEEIDGKHCCAMFSEVFKVIGVEIALEILYFVVHTVRPK